MPAGISCERDPRVPSPPYPAAVIPVVLLSSISLEDGTAWLAAAGFAGYLAKPIDIDGFPDQVRRFCRRGVG